MAFDPKSARGYFETPMPDVHTNHPLIPSLQNYYFYRKFVSIHSEDRDYIAYPRSSEFEIELPEDITNIFTVRLQNWAFPANYNTFSFLNGNISMTFKISEPYNPNINGLTDLLQQAIFEALYYNKDNNYTIFIQEGFYNPTQMVTELTNKFNAAVTNYIKNYFTNNGYDTLIPTFDASGGYSEFVIVYNSVSQKIWFGNRSSEFILTNEIQLIKDIAVESFTCGVRSQVPDFSEWGLPGNLGLSRCNVTAKGQPGFTPRFFYGNVFPGDDGYWLVPNTDLSGSHVYFIECPFKINLMGPSSFYIEIPQLNCLDETQPFNVSSFTVNTNGTNGIVNSAFAKIDLTSTPISQFFNRESVTYKYFYPPLERLRRLKIKIRYHNGRLVDFGVFNFTFMIEFVCLTPQQPRNYRHAFQGAR
jgi:hypothetical protein